MLSQCSFPIISPRIAGTRLASERGCSKAARWHESRGEQQAALSIGIGEEA